ncbi:1120_t:CDS:2 [Gigaspora margarita]|uniref:1120_t:CDS:1 n=1 Tax=Gigaspora margarita TaxID=4874 RepID=A0ABN7V3F5_GIGMA|nr:1120_t:CDS:2 [Gigaspora margarita]
MILEKTKKNLGALAAYNAWNGDLLPPPCNNCDNCDLQVKDKSDYEINRDDVVDVFCHANTTRFILRGLENLETYKENYQ